MVAKQANGQMTGDEFINNAQDSGLTERQAIAFFNRRVANISRQETAEALGTSASNVDNLERAAREKISNAYELVKLVRAVDVNPDGL
jgi:transcriptional regulator